MVDIRKINELSTIFKRLNQGSMIGRISDKRFMELPADYETGQKEPKECANLLQGELSQTPEATENAEKFIKFIEKLSAIFLCVSILYTSAR